MSTVRRGNDIRQEAAWIDGKLFVLRLLGNVKPPGRAIIMALPGGS